jgi:hypothetical protein
MIHYLVRQIPLLTIYSDVEKEGVWLRPTLPDSSARTEPNEDPPA